MINPLISIVVPSYNGQKFLREAIDSVINQSYKNWELILVDDGSKDQTFRIMQEYSEKYENIFCYQHSKNSGISNTINTGFSTAKGDYYTWISDDNIFKSNAVEVMVREIVNNSASVVYTDYNTIDENGNFIANEKVGNIRKIIFNYVIGPCFLYKKECHLAVGGYSADHKSCEDYDFFLRLFNKGFSFKKIDETLFLFRKHQLAMSSNVKLLLFNTERIVIENAQSNSSRIKKKDLAKIYLDRFIKNKYKINWLFITKAFYYQPFYSLVRLPQIILELIKRFKS